MGVHYLRCLWPYIHQELYYRYYELLIMVYMES